VKIGCEKASIPSIQWTPLTFGGRSSLYKWLPPDSQAFSLSYPAQLFAPRGGIRGGRVWLPRLLKRKKRKEVCTFRVEMRIGKYAGFLTPYFAWGRLILAHQPMRKPMRKGRCLRLENKVTNLRLLLALRMWSSTSYLRWLMWRVKIFTALWTTQNC